MPRTRKRLFGGNAELVEVPHHISRKQTTPSEIPLTIYTTWHSHSVPIGMKTSIDALIQGNPECDYYLFSDEQCIAFIKSHFGGEVLKAYNSLKPGAFKADLWRYCVLYQNGGIYIDIKYSSVQPIVNLLKGAKELFVKDRGVCGVTGCIYDCVYNAFMASVPKNPIFKYCIDDIVNSCRNRLYKRNFLDITGPCILGAAVKHHMSIDYIKGLPLHFNGDNIMKGNTIVCRRYEKYGDEQKKHQKTQYYRNMYNKRNVYT